MTDAGNIAEAAKYVLYGVRLETSGSLLEVFVPPSGNPALDPGVTPRLVFNVRQALDALPGIVELFPLAGSNACKDIAKM